MGFLIAETDIEKSIWLISIYRLTTSSCLRVSMKKCVICHFIIEKGVQSCGMNFQRVSTQQSMLCYITKVWTERHLRPGLWFLHFFVVVGFCLSLHGRRTRITKLNLVISIQELLDNSHDATCVLQFRMLFVVWSKVSHELSLNWFCRAGIRSCVKRCIQALHEFLHEKKV